MNAYSPSYTLVFYACPTDTSAARAAHRRLVKALRLRVGGGVYGSRVARNGKGWTLLLGAPAKVESELMPLLPPDGELKLFGVTSKQVGLGHNFWGKRRACPQA